MVGCNTCETDNSGIKTTNCVTGGNCGSGGCQTSGCDKHSVFDWLADMEIPVDDKFDVIEVRFKAGRKEFYRNSKNILLYPGDAEAMQAVINALDYVPIYVGKDG